MSTHYTLTIRRPSDRKIIAECSADLVKSILQADDDMIDVRGGEFKLSDVVSMAHKCARKIEECNAEIAELKEGRWKCANQEVWNNVQEDIGWKEESVKDWTYAYNACLRLHGFIECMAESMMMPKPEWDTEECPWDPTPEEIEKMTDEEKDSHKRFNTMAYKYWATRMPENECKDERDKRSDLEYCWADSVICSISAD